MNRHAAVVALVDDEPFILKLHARMLKDLGVSVCHAFESGAATLDAIDRGLAPDLIFLDLSMPGMDGIEFIRHLVQRSFAGSLILVSGEDSRLLETGERLVRAHGIRILGHISKPVSRADLEGMIGVWEGGDPVPDLAGRARYSPAEVEAGIRGGELVNHYQPRVSLRTGELTGVECLARWAHPRDGLVMPDAFIGVAEDAGLIGDLTRVTFRSAMTEIAELERQGLPLKVSVNLAAATLSSIEFADFAAEEARRASVRPHNVILEVTESQLIKDLRAPLEVLTRLRLMRFTLSIDDFGTGYSSLAQLRTIPFDELKIDQGFVHRATRDATARAIYDASLGLAKQLNMEAVAEGVEDRGDWDLVRSTGCDEAQGYFVSRAVPASELPSFRERWKQRLASELGLG